MNINKKALALIAGGLVVIAAIIYFVFVRDYTKTAPPATETATQPEVVAPVTVESLSPVSGVAPATKEELASQSAQRLALSFASRYGSSSNQSGFANLSDLEVFMTDAMIARTRAFVATELAKPTDNTKYSGVTTTSVTADLTDSTPDAAQALVKTKRQETAVDGSVKNYDQSLRLTLKKVNDEWKVDSAEWLK